VTAAGVVDGVGACAAVGLGWWWAGLALWLANRLADGLDGPLARRRGATDAGGFVDLVADFTVSAGFAVAVAVPRARLACVALLGTYYVSGAALLAWSSLAERRNRDHGDQRSLHFIGGLAEGTETIVAYVAFCLAHRHAEAIAWSFTAVVGVTAVQRVVHTMRQLHPDRPATARSRPAAGRWPGPRPRRPPPRGTRPRPGPPS